MGREKMISPYLRLPFDAAYLQPNPLKQEKFSSPTLYQLLLEGFNSTAEKIEAFRQEQAISFTAADEFEIERGESYAVNESLKYHSRKGDKITLKLLDKCMEQEGIDNKTLRDFIKVMLLQNRVGWNVAFNNLVTAMLIDSAPMGTLLNVPTENSVYQLTFDSKSGCAFITTKANVVLTNTEAIDDKAVDKAVVGKVESVIRISPDKTVKLMKGDVLLKPAEDKNSNWYKVRQGLEEKLAGEGFLIASGYYDKTVYLSPHKPGILLRAWTGLKTTVTKSIDAFFAFISYRDKQAHLRPLEAKSRPLVDSTQQILTTLPQKAPLLLPSDEAKRLDEQALLKHNMITEPISKKLTNGHTQIPPSVDEEPSWLKCNKY